MSSKNYCRLCAKLSSATVDVYGDIGNKFLLHLKIIQHLNITITSVDPLSKYVCILCIGKLDYLEKFRSECISAQIILRRNMHEKSLEAKTIVNAMDFSDQKSEELSDDPSVNNECEEKHDDTLGSRSNKKVANNCDENSSLSQSSRLSEECGVFSKNIIHNTRDIIDVKMEVIEEDEEEVIKNIIPVNDFCKTDESKNENNMKNVCDLCNKNTVMQNSDGKLDSSHNILQQLLMAEVKSSSSTYENPTEVDAGTGSEIDSDHYIECADISNDSSCNKLLLNNSINCISKHTNDESRNDPLIKIDHKSNNEAIDISGKESSIDSLSSCLYFTLQEKDNLSNDREQLLIRIFQCVQNLYEGKCSLMPYFMKWPVPNGGYRVGFVCFCCTKIYYTRTDIWLHLFEHLCSVCELCKKCFRTKNRFKKHITDYHFFDIKNGKLKCKFCNKALNTKIFIEHQRTHCQFHCGVCTFKSSNYNALNTHIQNHNLNKKVCDSDCLSFFNDDQKGLLAHNLKITGESGFVCKFCNIGYHTENDLKLHYAIYGSNHVKLAKGDSLNVLDGTVCSTSITRASQNSSNFFEVPTKESGKVMKFFHDILEKKIPLDKLPLTEFERQGKTTTYGFRCPICRRGVHVNEKDIFPHIRNHLLLSCSRCKYIFISPNEFKKHMMLKSCKLPVYKCNICVNVAFDNVSEYLSHSYDHKLKKICSFCSEVFAKSQEKERHIMKMHEDKIIYYYCEQCGNKFKSNQNLKHHISSVHGGNSLQEVCPNCGVKHIRYKHNFCKKRTEQNEEFICAYCSEVFSRKGYLISHIRVHLNMKMFECGICKKGFNRKTSLNKHKSDMHSGKTWNCTVDDCDKDFSFKSALSVHMRQKHGIL